MAGFLAGEWWIPLSRSVELNIEKICYYEITPAQAPMCG